MVTPTRRREWSWDGKSKLLICNIYSSDSQNYTTAFCYISWTMQPMCSPSHWDLDVSKSPACRLLAHFQRHSSTQQHRPSSANMWCEAPRQAFAKIAVEAVFVMQTNPTFLPRSKHLDYHSWLDQQFKGKFTLTTITFPFQLKQDRRLVQYSKIKSCTKGGVVLLL